MSQYKANAISGNDVKDIYIKIESEKKGSFYVEVRDKKEVTPNHIHENVAKFYKDQASNGVDTKKLQHDASTAKSLISGLIIE